MSRQTGLKGKGFKFEKGNILWAEGKKSAHKPVGVVVVAAVVEAVVVVVVMVAVVVLGWLLSLDHFWSNLDHFWYTLDNFCSKKKPGTGKFHFF